MQVIKNVFAIGLILTLALTAHPAGSTEQKEDSTLKQKAVLVTGASSGIGRKITELLATKGYFVYAGARKQKDLDTLDLIENVKAVRLDVTVQSDIDAAVETIKKEGRGLYGLVNNAGVAIAGPVTEVDEKELQWMFDINVFGVYRITQAFAPLIIENKGRITITGSISGVLSGLFFGPYSMSKHAIEAYTDALAAEMQRFDVKVSVIEPGSYRSALSKTARDRMLEKGYVKQGSPFAEDMQQWLERQSDTSKHKEPDAVAEAIMHALFDDNPKPRYMVVPNQEQASWTIGRSIQKLIQLNEEQAYSYSQEELIEMLDAMMRHTEE